MHVKRGSALGIYLFLSGLSTFATSTIFTINMIYQIETVKLNPFQLVLVGTTLESTVFLCQVPTGVLADVYSRRLSVIIGYLLMGSGFLVEGLFPHFVVILACQVLWGCGDTFISGALEAWCADEIGEEHVGRVFIRGAQFGQIASLLAIPLSIGLATYRLNLPIIIGACFLLFLGGFLALFMPERHFRPTPRQQRSSWQTLGRIMVDGVQTIRRSRMLWIILVIMACNAMASEGYDRLSTDHLIKDYVFPTLGHLPTLTWFGILNVGGAILGLVATEIVRRTLDTNNHHVMIRVMFAFSMLHLASVVLFALAGNFPLVVLGLWSAGVFRSLLGPLYTTWITTNSEPKIRATILSLFGQIDAIGQIAGGPAVGLIGTVVSLRAALLTTAAILSPNIIFYARALRLNNGTPVGREKGKEHI